MMGVHEDTLQGLSEAFEYVNGDKTNDRPEIVENADEETEMDRILLPVEQRNTGKGIPSAILHAGRPLNNRQQKLLDSLPSFNSCVTVDKNSVSMTDLSALTAITGVEFAMFTKGQERLIIRGDVYHVPVDTNKARELNLQGWKWSGHTHPGVTDFSLWSSDGDHLVLEQFDQESSVIYNSKGDRNVFSK